MSKEKIFVSAYACEPNMGTEIGVGWHWTLEMSKYYELWVLTRRSNQLNIEQWMRESEEKYNIHFVYFDLPKSLRFWKNGLRGVRTYYILWQLLTNSIVKRVMQKNDIRIYHLLTYGNSLWPASSYGMKQFFIWGPTGGVDSVPYEYSRYYSVKSRLVEWVRRMVVRTLPFNCGFQKRCRNADLIFCKSNSMYQAIPLRYRQKALLFTDVAVEPIIKAFPTIKKNSGIIRYLVVGRFDPWRGFDILIEAFALALIKNPQIELEIIGDGADRRRLEMLIVHNGIQNKVRMDGKISIEDYYNKIRTCDIVINSCLKEGAVTTAFDSLSFGKPLIGIETGGYTRYFKPEYSIIIPLKGRKETINNLYNAIVKMSDDEFRNIMSCNAFEASKKYTWNIKGQEIANEIDHAYNNLR